MDNEKLPMQEVSLKEIISVLYKRKWLIVSITLVSAIASVMFALSLPNIYTSKAKLMPNSDASAAASSLPGSIGGLASLAGVSLGSGNSDVNTTLAIELLKSRQFLKSFVDKYDLLVPLIASTGADDNGKLIINDALYNVDTGQWVRNVPKPKKVIPSAEEVFKHFSQILSFEQDTKTGFLTVKLSFYSPELAQQWLTLLIKEVNEYVRLHDLEEAKNSVAYLERTVEATSNTTMRNSFYRLIEEQNKKLLLSELRSEYVYKTVDPASLPEEKASPKRALICIAGTFLGALLIVFLVLVSHYTLNTRQSS
jgi:uncharacterized protein involved in exopolysaccharide biosynthesis